ncbi:MAG: hypothetical protein MH204_00810, partial [Fimbriimonadaceae bacterium]|nr:hypothetical protein [Fimbriimonadaceae bacterium]
MPVFQYVATDPSGETKRGLEHGPDLAVTADALRSRGLVVREIRLAESSGMEAPRPQAPTESAGFESPRPFDSGPPTEERSRMQTDVLGPLVGGVPLKDL